MTARPDRATEETTMPKSKEYFTMALRNAVDTVLREQTPPFGSPDRLTYECPACHAERELLGAMRLHLNHCDVFIATVTAELAPV
jgi:hypothetical protein